MAIFRSKKKRRLTIVLLLIGVLLSLAQCTMKFRTDDAVARADFEKRGVMLSLHTIRVDGYSLHYAKVGSDSLPTLFFVHGSPGSWDAFQRYMQDSALLQKFRMVSIDRPGFGFSSFGKARNLEAQSKLIGPLLHIIQNGQPVFGVGHSLGGPMVLRLCIDYPQAFDGLVLLAASVSPQLEKPEKWRPVLFKTPLNYLVPGAMRPSNEELWYLKADLRKMEPELPQITVPVWIVHGDKDPLVPVENVHFIQEHCSNAKPMRTTIIPGANHFIPWQHFREIRAVLLSLPDDAN
jgi:pimeloyl-ACP methyl ester carboxylesterase